MWKPFRTVIYLFVAVFLVIVGVFLGLSVKWQISYENTENIREDNVLKDLSPVEWEEAIISAVEKISPAVVSIIASKDVPVIRSPFRDMFFYEEEMQRREVGGGTGFIISEHGIILTNRHVVSDEQADYMVFTNDGNSFSAEVLARDPVQDLAVLKIEGSGFPVVSLGDSSDLRIGQTAIAIGNALGEFRNTVSVGVISGLGRRVVATDGVVAEVLEDVIQTDAGINRGNSGGPLIDLRGNVIGINTAMAVGAQNIGFAIPVNNAQRAISGALEGGRIIYPFLGVRYILVDENVKNERNLPVSYGALILTGDRGEPAVDPDSGAAKAGLREGDIILEVNGVRIDAETSLVSLIMIYNPGDNISLTVMRGSEELTINAVLGERSS